MRHDGSRAALIVGLLVGSLGTTALLAWQANRAFEEHRLAASSVLRDYASLAANEYVRRATARLGYDGYYPLVTALARRMEAAPDLDQAVRALEEESDGRLRPALALARRYFARSGAGTLRFAGGEPETAARRAWVEEVTAAPGDRDRPYYPVHGLVSGEPASVVFGSIASPSPTGVVGFEVDLEALGPYLSAAFDANPLLPAPLGAGDVTNEALFVSVVDQAGIERFRSAGTPHPELEVEVAFGEAYGGVLEGSTVRLSLDPGAASALVPGGIPPSRRPLDLGLLLLAAALLATAIREVRRERRLQELRGAFVAGVSHELRTPLTQIRLFAETLLLGRVRSPEEGRRSLEVIVREARRLSHLVDNALQFSRAEAGKLRVAPVAGPLEPTVSQTLELFRPMLAASGARLVERIGPGVQAVFDAEALGQVLLNLLDNAVKYGPRGQQIVVGVERADGGARLFVEDEGPGIPEGERDRVFERFHRLERDRSSAVAGTGIGLSIVQELAALQGGRARIEDAPGGGARFVVELAAAPAEHPA